MCTGLGRGEREGREGSDGVPDRSVAGNGGCEAVTAMSVLLSSGHSIKWTRKSFGDYSAPGHLTQFLKNLLAEFLRRRDSSR